MEPPPVQPQHTPSQTHDVPIKTEERARPIPALPQQRVQRYKDKCVQNKLFCSFILHAARRGRARARMMRRGPKLVQPVQPPQIPSSPRTLRKCHLHTRRTHSRSPPRNRKRTTPPSRNQHAPRRRARTTIAIAFPINLDADPTTSDNNDNGPTINHHYNNDAHSDTRPRPTIPSRATRSPGTAASAYERALVVVVVDRRSATRSRSRPFPFTRTWIRGKPRTTISIGGSSTRAEFHQRFIKRVIRLLSDDVEYGSSLAGPAACSCAHLVCPTVSLNLDHGTAPCYGTRRVNFPFCNPTFCTKMVFCNEVAFIFSHLPFRDSFDENQRDGRGHSKRIIHRDL